MAKLAGGDDAAPDCSLICGAALLCSTGNHSGVWRRRKRLRRGCRPGKLGQAAHRGGRRARQDFDDDAVFIEKDGKRDGQFVMGEEALGCRGAAEKDRVLHSSRIQERGDFGIWIEVKAKTQEVDLAGGKPWTEFFKLNHLVLAVGAPGSPKIHQGSMAGLEMFAQGCGFAGDRRDRQIRESIPHGKEERSGRGSLVGRRGRWIRGSILRRLSQGKRRKEQSGRKQESDTPGRVEQIPGNQVSHAHNLSLNGFDRSSGNHGSAA